jgi:hypothetical protein
MIYSVFFMNSPPKKAKEAQSSRDLFGFPTFRSLEILESSEYQPVH